MLPAALVLAATHASAPAGGGLRALDVTVDLGSATVDASGRTIPIALDRAKLPAAEDVTVESIAIGKGKHVVHVRVPAKDEDASALAWEAIVAEGRDPIFVGFTGLTTGDPGERTGKAIQVVPSGDKSVVLVGDVREDVRICGQAETLLDPYALYADSLELRGPVTAQRLSAGQQQGAQRIVATDKGSALDTPLARLLVARGSSVPGSRGAELTDGDVGTAWSEKRPGIGQGEFVVMAAPRDVPIARMQIVVAPPQPDDDGAAPKSLYVVTSSRTFEVTMPGDAWLKPGEAYEIRFPEPIEASCVSIVLDDAYVRAGRRPKPEVSIAELVAYSEFDAPGATLDDVAKKLSSERGIAAAQVLERAGAPALVAAERAYDSLDGRGRALAIDVAASHDRCDEAAPLLARALCEGQGEAPRKAREKLERCKGAATELAKRVREDAAARACVAPTLATIAPAEALEPIADAMNATAEADRDTRAVLRASMGAALQTAPRARVAALVGDAKRSAAARLEIMRAAGARVVEAPAESEAVAAELSRARPSMMMRVRYLMLEPLGELARAGDGSAAARVADAIAHDPEWPVRAFAAERAAGVASANAALVGALRDPEPRVREAALQSLAQSPPKEAFELAADLLSDDRWPFVKTQAIAVLVKAAPSRDVDDAIGHALHASSARVRGAAVVALALRRASGWRDGLRERLGEPGEDADVRALAAGALGAVCDAESIDRLTDLARLLAVPGTDDDQSRIALGALQGLARLHPSDLRDRIAPLLAPAAPPHVRAAAQQALAARGGCR